MCYDNQRFVEKESFYKKIFMGYIRLSKGQKVAHRVRKLSLKD